MFGGNLARHPSFTKDKIFTPYSLEGSDYVMNNTFWIGCHPALTQAHLEYVIETIKEYFEKKELWKTQ